MFSGMSMRLCLLIVALLIVLPGCRPSTGVYHTVKKGQTLYRISKAYDLDERYLARINGVGDPRALPVGKRIFVPGAERVVDVPATVSGRSAKPAAKPAPSTARKSTSSAQESPSRKTSAQKKSKTAEKTPKPVEGQFIWPVRGEVVRDFCTTGDDPCKGVEIAVSPGTAVLASSAGKVIYSGDGIRGYGNLLIIRHDKEFFSVYGFNEKNLVESGVFVSKGQKIALSGTPPGGGRARLHFEIRHGKESVDPSLYLP